jgi:hypothetical protein
MKTHQSFDPTVADARAVVLRFWGWVFSAADYCAAGIEVEWSWQI